MAKITALDLIFQDPVYFFGPRSSDSKSGTHPNRQKLRGKLRMIATRPTKLELVEITFRGQSELNWRDPHKSPHAFMANKMYGYKSLRKYKQVLLKKGTVPCGVTDLGFEISIPGHLCPSFQSPYVDTRYRLLARVVPSGRFTQELMAEKEVTIIKTLLPKDIVTGITAEYQAPRLPMSGCRPDVLRWQFKVPRYVCLEDALGVEFEGRLEPVHGTPPEVTKMEIDVVQEELYTDQVTEKRHLIFCTNPPSNYLYPPLNTLISFHFPIHKKQSTNGIGNKFSSLRRVMATPFHPSIKQNRPLDTIGSVGCLSYSVDSPFLRVRHYIRVVIHLANSSVICLGLPFKLTRRVHLASQPNDLPTYQLVTQDGEALPGYDQAKAEEDEAGNEADDLHGSSRAGTRRQTLIESEAAERSLEDFMLIKQTTQETCVNAQANTLDPL